MTTRLSNQLFCQIFFSQHSSKQHNGKHNTKKKVIKTLIAIELKKDRALKGQTIFAVYAMAKKFANYEHGCRWMKQPQEAV